MRRATKVWLAVATVLIAVGMIAFTAIMAVNRWDFDKLSTVKYETNSHEISDEFHSVSISTETADVIFLPSDAESCKVICHEEQNMKHSVSVADGVLTVSSVDTRKWYENIVAFPVASPRVTVYLPEAEYQSLVVENDTGDVEIPKELSPKRIEISSHTGDVKCYASAVELVKIKTDTGDIRVENLSAGAVELSTSTGDVIASSVKCEGDVSVHVSTGDARLTDIACKSLISSGDTGDLYLKNVIAAERFSIERNTGDVKLEKCDAAELFIETDTGDVEGTLLSDKVFVTKTDTGSVRIPNSVSGGRCEITTDTGDIKISID